MKLPKLLKKHVYKDELKVILYAMELPVSGNMDDLIKRIMKKTNNDQYETLSWLNKDTLSNILGYYNLKKSGLKDNLIHRIISELLDTPKKKGKKIERKTIEPTSEPKKAILKKEITIEEKSSPTSFTEISNNIQNWIPHMRYKTEGEYRIDLNSYLNGLGYHTRMEKGESLADILVNDSVPIEVKKNPRISDYDRALGQLRRHCKAYGSTIVVICDPKRLDQFNDFFEDVKETLRKYSISIIKK